VTPKDNERLLAEIHQARLKLQSNEKAALPLVLALGVISGVLVFLTYE
jgi:hypothetical protein